MVTRAYTGLNLLPQEQAIADALDRQQRGGEALALSTIGGVSDLGRGRVNQAQQGRRALGGLTRTRQLQEREDARNVELRGQQLEDIAADRAFRRTLAREQADYAQELQAQGNAAALDRAQLSASTQLATTGMRLTSEEERQVQRIEAEYQAQLRNIEANTAEADKGRAFRELENARARAHEEVMQGRTFDQQTSERLARQEFETGERLARQDFTLGRDRAGYEQAVRMFNLATAADEDAATTAFRRSRRAAEDQRDWQTGEREATQDWRTGEREASQAFSNAQDAAAFERDMARLNAGFDQRLTLQDQQNAFTGAQNALDREARALQARAVAAARASGDTGRAGAPKLNQTRATEIRNTALSLGTINSIKGMMSQLSPEQNDRLNRQLLDAGISAVIPTDFQSYTRALAQTEGDPEAQKFLAAGYEFESELSRITSGLALTKFEIEQRQRWSPFAPGISMNERAIRMAVLEEKLSRVMGAEAEFYPEYVNALGGLVERMGAAGMPQSTEVNISALSDEELDALINGRE